MKPIKITDAYAPADDVLVWTAWGKTGVVRVRTTDTTRTATVELSADGVRAPDTPRTATVELSADGVRKLRKALKKALAEIEPPKED